ncbi:hypothetical protein EVAR_71548_1 [Eumeta japonica]|uniref:DDE-1 domain-containing protein n=1 Tax=Eumeta variegata TaxID=151549 RepID=A0A4C1T3N4_EUMVA|nr:hypothetical protein EVAR_71548_1 [Eumeta japonica]
MGRPLRPRKRWKDYSEEDRVLGRKICACVRVYTRTSTNKAQWSSETLSKAEALTSQGHSMRSADKAMNIPFSSLQKRLKKNNSSEPRLGRLPVFTADVEKLEKDGPAGAIYKCSDNGWINEHLFFEWLQHFAMYTKPSSQPPVLLILDNHASHTSLMMYDFCKQNNIHMPSLPPHTSHRMQPLDLTFFGPLKAIYKKECDLFKKNRLAEKITPHDVAAILNRAYSTVASINKGESGFPPSGIVPYNANIFSDEDFIAAEVLTQPKVIIQDTSIVIPSTSAPTDPMPSTSSATIHHMPSISSIAVDSIPSISSATLAPGILNSNIEDLLPLPIKMIPEKPIRKGRMKQHAKIMTSTPVKDSLVEKENKKASRAAKGKKPYAES